MSTPLICPLCGGKQKTLRQGKCDYCGSPLASSAPPTTDSGASDLGSRFLALEAHPRYAELLEHEPDIARHLTGGTCVLAFLSLFTVTAGGFALAGLVAVSTVGPFGIPFILIPGAMAAAGGFGIVTTLRKVERVKSAPWRRVPALVLGRRTEVRSERSHAFLSLEFADGARQEYPAQGSILGRLADGDMGVAYLKADTLVDFERLPV